MVERSSTRYALSVAGHRPWGEIKRKSLLNALERATSPEKMGRPDCLPRSDADAKQAQDEPKPVAPEVQPDEDFTRDDFMRDLRTFVPQRDDE